MGSLADSMPSQISPDDPEPHKVPTSAKTPAFMCRTKAYSWGPKVYVFLIRKRSRGGGETNIVLIRSDWPVDSDA